MKTPKSVPEDQREMVAVAAVAQMNLTSDEIAMLTHFRNMDDRSQALMLRHMPAQAVDCPRRAVPRLWLVDGGAK